MPSLESVLSDESDHWRVKCERLEAINAEMLVALKRIVELSAGYPLLQAEMDIPLAKAAITRAEGGK